MSKNHPTQTELQIWERAKKLSEFRPEDLVNFGIQKSTAQTFTRHWKHRGWITIYRVDDQNRRYYCALDLARPEIEPVSGVATAEGNMWRVMRQMHVFTPIDVAAHANAGGVEVSIQKARYYCQKLSGVGYLKIRETAIPGKREAAYSLIENTGPRAPVVARIKGLMDPNTGKFFPADDRVRA